MAVGVAVAAVVVAVAVVVVVVNAQALRAVTAAILPHAHQNQRDELFQAKVVNCLRIVVCVAVSLLFSVRHLCPLLLCVLA